MKYGMSMLLAAILFVTAFSGCSGAETAQQENTTAQTAPVQTAESAGGESTETTEKGTAAENETPAAQSGTESAAEEPQREAMADPYLRHYLPDLLKAEKLVFADGLENASAEIFNENDAYSSALLLTGTVKDLNAGRLLVTEEYVFDGAPVQRIQTELLVEAGIDAALEIYLDDAQDPWMTMPIPQADREEGWMTEWESCVLSETLTGRHRISVGFDLNAEETKTAGIFFRSLEFMQTTVPVLNIRIDESEEALAKGFGTEQEMLESYDHSVKSTGAVDIVVPAGYTGDYSDVPQESLQGLKLEYIRGRGESTWGQGKNPFRLKLDKKQDLFGMGANKNWVLLANYFDISHMRNRLTFWLGTQLGLAYTPQCVPVELILGNRYQGLYLLCEQVRLGSGRVEIDELSEEDTEAPAVTGGYLLRMCREEDEDPYNRFLTDRGAVFLNKEPEFGEDYKNDAQRDYIRDYVQKTEDAIFGEAFRDGDGRSYTDYLDLDSAVSFWWVQEFSQNQDAYGTDSNYLYKVRDGKLYFGPLWDFDYVAYRRENRDLVNSAQHVWINRLKEDPAFIAALEEQWETVKGASGELTKAGGVMDVWRAEITDAQVYDEERWGRGEWGLESYEDDVETLRTWIIDRTEKIDAHMTGGDFAERTRDPRSWDN